MDENRIFELQKNITKYKYIYIGIYKYKCSHRIFNISYRFGLRSDHEGLCFTIDLFNRSFDFEFCDSRHWDYENKMFFDPEKFDSMGRPLSIKQILKNKGIYKKSMEISQEEFDVITGKPFEEDVFGEEDGGKKKK